MALVQRIEELKRRAAAAGLDISDVHVHHPESWILEVSDRLDLPGEFIVALPDSSLDEVEAFAHDLL